MDCFIADETFEALRYICYGFAAIAFEFAIKEGHTVTYCRVNQDVNEHHFSNTRASVGGHDNPNEAECNRAAVVSTILRLTRMNKGNCSELNERTTQMSLQRQRSKFKK